MTTAVLIPSRLLALATGLVLLVSSPVLAQSTGRKVVDPKGPFTKLVGELTQAKDAKMAGNAFVVGAQGCHIVTNFHIAFGKEIDPETGKTIIIDGADIGHKVKFAFDLDSKTGKFKKNMKATVVEFGDYDSDTTTGLVGDLALLRLESCLGKEFAGPELDRPTNPKILPTGKLMTVSTSRNAKNQNEILVEEGCLAEKRTHIGGIMVSRCHAEPGMSGSMILEQGEDQKWRLVGITTTGRKLSDGSRVSFAIHSGVLTKFIDSVIGAESIAISPVADERKPQSEDQTAMTSPVRARTVVR